MPSLVEGVVRDGRLVWWGARGSLPEGSAGVDVQYRIGSITKTLVAVLVLRLRDEGRLSLDDRIDAHVGGVPFGNRTIAQLLSHTGGVAAELPGAWWERSPGVDATGLRQAMASGVVVDAPGRAFHYSNVAYAVLGELVSRVRGRAWFDVLAAEVLAPLEMRDTTWAPRSPAATGWAVHPYADVVMPEVVQDVGAMGSAGQLWSTVADLGRWAGLLAGDGGEVLSGDTVAEMCRPRAVVDGDEWVSGMGLGVQLWRDKHRRLCGHGGSMPGFNAGVRVDPASGVAHVAVSNCTSAADAGEVEDVFDIMDECEPRLPIEWAPASDVPQRVLELTGAWFWGTSEAALYAEDGGWLRLEHVSGMTRASRFRPNGDGSWTGLDHYFAGERLRVVRDATGRVQHIDIGTFVFTRSPYAPPESVPGGIDGGWTVT